MVDWTLSKQIARFAAGGAQVPDLGVDLRKLAADAEVQVARYTGLELPDAVPSPELVDRAAWADINLTRSASCSIRSPTRMSERLGSAGPLAGPLRMAAGATIAAEAGLVVGYMSQRVLGQFELSLIQPEAPTRLLFVAPNLRKAVGELDVDRDAFLDWIVLHELTHVLQFPGVPWLRDHLGGLLREYLDTVDVQIKRGAAGGLPSMPNAGELVERFREGGLMALIQTREQRELMDRAAAGDGRDRGLLRARDGRLGETLVPGYESLRDAMDRRRRSRSAPERLLQKLLGLELKMRQYEQGKRFCDAVVGRGGIEGLNRVWRSPRDMPTPAELDDPPPGCAHAVAPRRLADRLNAASRDPRRAAYAAPSSGACHVTRVRRVYLCGRGITSNKIPSRQLPEEEPECPHSTTTQRERTPPQRRPQRPARRPRPPAQGLAPPARKRAARPASSGCDHRRPRAKAETFGLQALALQAQRPALVSVGAALTAAENVRRDGEEVPPRPAPSVRSPASRSAVTTDLKKFERRGERAKKRVEREVKRTRTRIERELRQRRNRRSRARSSATARTSSAPPRACSRTARGPRPASSGPGHSLV